MGEIPTLATGRLRTFHLPCDGFRLRPPEMPRRAIVDCTRTAGESFHLEPSRRWEGVCGMRRPPIEQTGCQAITWVVDLIQGASRRAGQGQSDLTRDFAEALQGSAHAHTRGDPRRTRSREMVDRHDPGRPCHAGYPSSAPYSPRSSPPTRTCCSTPAAIIRSAWPTTRFVQPVRLESPGEAGSTR